MESKRTTTRWKVVQLLAVLAALGLLLAACEAEDDPDEDVDEDPDADPTEGESYNWQLAETHVEDYPTTQADIWFADELRERTDGRIDVEVFPDSQLGEEADVLEQVQVGAIEMTRTSASPVSEFVEDWGVFSLPYIFDDEDHLWDYLLSDAGDEMLEGLREGGFYGLAYYDSGARNFYTVDEPVESPEDLEGQNIRVQPGAVNADMVEAMGGSATTMDFGEVYSGLEQGVIDGAENNEPSYVSTGHYEVAEYFTLDGHQRVPEVLLIAEDIWDGLDEADQELIREVAQESIEVQRELWAEEVEESFAAIEERGNEIIEVDVEEFQEAVEPMLEEYGEQYSDILDDIDAAR